VISEGCIINAEEIKKSVIGNRSRIGEGTVIQNTYVMGNDLYQSIEEIRKDKENQIPLIGIGERCFIDNAILDKNCRIGNDVYIKGGKHIADCTFDLYCVKEGIVVIRKGAIIPDNFSIK